MTSGLRKIRIRYMQSMGKVYAEYGKGIRGVWEREMNRVIK
jgi:hypothetical protein